MMTRLSNVLDQERVALRDAGVTDEAAALKLLVEIRRLRNASGMLFVPCALCGRQRLITGAAIGPCEFCNDKQQER